MSDDRMHDRLERIADGGADDALAEEIVRADRLDAQRDVSTIAMVGLIVVVIGFGLAAWGVTTPGFFQRSVPQVSCAAGPGPQRCVAFVDGRRIEGTMEEVQDRLGNGRPPGLERFLLGVGILLVGGIITSVGVVRARRDRG